MPDLDRGITTSPDHLPGVGPRIHGYLNERRVNAGID